MPTYTVILKPAVEGGYLAEVPALEIVTEGETREEAIAMARDAIEGVLATLPKPWPPDVAEVLELPVSA